MRNADRAGRAAALHAEPEVPPAPQRPSEAPPIMASTPMAESSATAEVTPPRLPPATPLVVPDVASPGEALRERSRFDAPTIEPASLSRSQAAVEPTATAEPVATEPVSRSEPAVMREPASEAETATEDTSMGVRAAALDRARTAQERRDTGRLKMIDAETGPILAKGQTAPSKGKSRKNNAQEGSVGVAGPGTHFHKRLGPIDYSAALAAARGAVRRNLLVVLCFTFATNVLVLAIPIYLFQISDRVLTSRSLDTLVMLTVIIVGAIVVQAMLDAVRRYILMRTAVEVAAQLGAPILSAAARAALHGSGREYQTLGDLGQLRQFLVSSTLLAFLDGPFAPIFVLAVFLVHPDLGFIVVTTAAILLVIALINQKITAGLFAQANQHQSKANLHLDSMSRNSQIINALAMIPEAVSIWGRDTAASLAAQVRAQDRNVTSASISKGVRLLTQVAMLGWGALLAIEGEITGGMVIAASIIAGRALGPIEGVIEGWSQYSLSRAAYGRIEGLLKTSPLAFERLQLPKPRGRLDVERLLYVPQGTKRVVLNGLGFRLDPGEALGIIGNSGAGKTTLGKMLVGSVLPTSGSVRLDLMDLRNWDPRQFGENAGYLPQDVQLFPGTIKQNIARMREDATDEEIFRAAELADVHDMIATLAQGYETFVAADGSPLSGGQKQRVALARAFFGEPKLVVLDEPNSNLDTAGDQALAKALGHARKSGITTVTITQKPQLLACVDKIMVLHEGTITLFGERNTVLAELAQRQKAGLL